MTIRESSSQLLCAADCFHMPGSIAYAGTATLTNESVSFEPSSFSRWVGARSWSVYLNEVERAYLSGVDQILVIETFFTEFRLIGRGAQRLFSRLYPQLDLLHGATESDYTWDERILLQSTGQRRMNDLLSARGEIILTSRSLRFEPMKLEQALWKEAELHLGLHQIEAVEKSLSAASVLPQHELTVRTSEEVIQLRGDIIPTLHGHLQVMLAHEAPDSSTVKSWTGMLHRAPLAYPGELVLGAGRFVFTPHSTLDSLLGVESMDLDLKRCHELQLQGFLEERLRLLLDGETLSFSLRESRECLEMLSQQLLTQRRLQDTAESAQHAEPEPATPAPTDEPALSPVSQLLSEKLKAWGLSAAHPLLSCQRCVRSVLWKEEESVLLPGWFGMDASRILFFPEEGSEHGALEIDLDAIHTPIALRRGRAECYVGTFDSMYRFTLLQGKDYVENIWNDIARIRKESRPELPPVVSAGAERRACYRVPIRREISGSLEFQDSGKPPVEIVVAIEDLSIGGCGAECEERELPEEDKVRVILQLQRGTFSCEAKIVYRQLFRDDRWRLGVQFVRVRPAQESLLLRTYMEYQRLELMLRTGEED